MLKNIKKLNYIKGPQVGALFSYLMVLLSVFQIQKLDLPKEFISPPPMIEHLVFGHNEFVADNLWIRVIQDIDYCEKQISTNVCRGKGWVARMLDAVTNLSPKIYFAYSVGAIALSVIVSDIQGATLLFDKGTKQFPNKWPLLYRAAYHAIYEEKNNAKAAELLEQAGRVGAPEWVFSLAAKLYDENGKREMGLNLLREMEAENADPKLISRMKERLHVQ
jgi:hypothetical protein